MGLFNKLKSSMDGGVQVHIQAPSSVAANQVIPVTVTISADSSQTINNVKAEVKAQAREEGLAMGGGQGIGVQDSRTMAQTVAQVESREPFTIGPGETKTVNLQLYLNGGVGGGTPFGQMGNMGGALGGALQAVASVAQNFDHVNYLYSVHASADVQGHHIGPSDKQSIQILPAAETQAGQPTPFAGNAAPGQTQPPTAQPESPAPVMPPTQPPADGISGQPSGPQF